MARTIVEEYWSAALVRLRMEVEGFARLVRHNGERGRENEMALSRLLTNLLPGYLQVGSGMLIDSTGDFSKQLDLVLFDAHDEPTAFAQTTQLLFPVEVALAAVEVKTKLTTSDLDDMIKKTESVRQLHGLAGVPSPLSVGFAYSTSVNPTTIHQRLAEAPDAGRPDLVCILDPGIVSGSEAVLGGSGWTSILTPLVDPGNPKSFVEPLDPAKSENLYEGRAHPVMPTPSGELVLMDPAWALLLFLDRVLAQLAVRSGRQLPIFCSYVRAVDRDVISL